MNPRRASVIRMPGAAWTRAGRRRSSTRPACAAASNPASGDLRPEWARPRPVTPNARVTSVPPTRAEISRELSSSFQKLHDALRHDRDELQRDVLLWQRWVRYAAVIITAALTLPFGAPETQPTWMRVGAVAGAYVLFHGLVALYLKRSSGKSLPPWLAQAVLIADVAVVGALVYFSSTPAQAYRILLLGFMLLQLSAFYFGRSSGLIAMGLVVSAYLAMSLLIPPYVPGPQPTLLVVGVNTLIFAFASGVPVFTFGSFRERMNKFRLLVKRAEMGDLAGVYDEGTDRLPDDLTLLGRGFNDMRLRLIELVGTDPLTQLLNRRALEQRLNREWRLAKRRGATLALLVVDIDHFKQINDSRGHPVGDLVLQELAEIMRATARDTDAIARVGGDEFVILLPDTGWQGAMTFAERLRRNVDDHQFDAELAGLELTISIGVALAQGADPVTAEDLLEEADRSLYKAKSGGRNRISA